jgi:hypothetical protein
MNRRTTAIALGFLAFGLSLALARVIWPAPPGDPEPTASQLPYLILLSLFDSLAFAIGLAFLVAAVPLVRRLARTVSGRLAWAAYAATGWLFVSWWPHSNLHRVTHDLDGIIVIDYTFHTTLMLAALILLRLFVVAARRAPLPRAASAASEAAGLATPGGNPAPATA